MARPVGQRVAVGEAEFEISTVCDPCHLMEEIRPGLQAELEGKRGRWPRRPHRTSPGGRRRQAALTAATSFSTDDLASPKSIAVFGR